MSLAECDALEETAHHLLRSPANWRRLLESLRQARDGGDDNLYWQRTDRNLLKITLHRN